MSNDIPEDVMLLGPSGVVVEESAASSSRFLIILALTVSVLLGAFGAWQFFQMRDGCGSGKSCLSLQIGKIAIADLPGRPDDDIVISAPIDRQLTAAEMATARERNAAVAFVKGPITQALPFRFLGNDADRAAARNCLALAMLYEAGHDDRGQRAVAQVILNRVRHPAYPSTVCGVVFQGSERRTGCQFTFTCDGALNRRQPEERLAAARVRAGEALAGSVFKDVGLATHYHTDWVYPYWSPSLEKLARIDTHLFFRWPGFWGSRAAYSKPHGGTEVIPTLKPVEPVEGEEGAPELIEGAEIRLAPDGTPLLPMPPARAELVLPAGMSEAALRGSKLMLMHQDGDAYGLQLDPQDAPEVYLGVAIRLCRTTSFCHVMGWRDSSAIPAGFPVSPAARSRMSFSYVRDKDKGKEDVRFDCALFPRPDPAQCL